MSRNSASKKQRRVLPAAVVCRPTPSRGDASGDSAVISLTNYGRQRSPSLVERYFYRHGLFCATYPRLVLIFTILTIIVTCFPLLTLPIYSTRPQTYVVPSVAAEEEENHRPKWLTAEKRVSYVQQIVMKAMVHPYKKDDLIRTDAFRGPLATAFKLHIEDLMTFRDPGSDLDMDHECLRTDGLSSRYGSMMNILPDYGCLILSPASLWGKDIAAFQFDPNLLSTIFNYQRSREGHSSLTDLVFGMRQRDSGITNFPLRNRQRVISYAATVGLKQHNPAFISAMKKHLLKVYPLHSSNSNATKEGEEVTHIYFPPIQQYYGEMVPLLITILVLFLYVYFSCNKIEVLRSKLGIALTAVVTVSSAICMSLGMSGLSLNVNPKVYFVPYLVAFISLENILIVTRSVTGTSSHLDVKIRVAQGLSQEGWNITKNLLCEITMLTVGFLMGVLDNSVQEFCILAVTGLLADFFLQMFFFVTVLSMDMTTVELGDVLERPLVRRKNKLFRTPVSGPGIFKSTSKEGRSKTTDVMAPSCNGVVDPPVAKRVKLLGFFARKRIVQRMFVLFMLVWLSMFIYQSGILESMLKTAQHDPYLGPHVQLPDTNDSENGGEPSATESGQTYWGRMNSALLSEKLMSEVEMAEKATTATGTGNNHLIKLQHQFGYNPWKRLPYTHWPMLFGLYNMSLYGHYITLLPPIYLSTTISPESAKDLRHPKEMDLQDATASAAAGTDLGGDEDVDDFSDPDSLELSSFAPTSPGELLLAFIFATPSILFIAYLFVMLYRCICSKNYAEWRASWTPSAASNDPTRRLQNDIYTQMIQEATLIQLDGHRHEIEFLAADYTSVFSMCLGGVISVWDSYTGEKLSELDRSSRFVDGPKIQSSFRVQDEEACYSSRPDGGRCRQLPDFSNTINTNFSMLSNEIGKSDDNDRSRPFNVERFQRLHQMSTSVVQDASTRGQPFTQVSCSVWAAEYTEGFVLLGCSNGTIELWDASDSKFKWAQSDESGVGITHLKLSGKKLVAARLTGHLEFFEVSRVTSVNSSSSLTSCSFSQQLSHEVNANDRGINVTWLRTSRVHQQPVTCLLVETGVVLTGSQDHTLKICRLEDQMDIYTLHGHCGPITCMLIDKTDNQSCAGSGSQDGMLCLWDMMTGACVYSIQAHDGSVMSLTHSPSYIISMGTDEKLCVWERFHGHLINTISLCGLPQCQDLVMLTHNLLVTGIHGQLVVWDVRLQEPVRRVRLGSSDSTHDIKLMLHLTGDTIACNYGGQLRFVRFPMLSDKKD